ncbi:MAG: T9SS type A sorting domain-containing protein, partial [candidate division Zixibacteria bacterium]|nr:T9SS type A sorting domain-containing protein [candidate division Zixibacteria bacterium]
IKVVPNPYIAWNMTQNSPDDRNILFNNLPDLCTIRIYTLSGDLVKTIEHIDGTGTDNLNLLSTDGLLFAAGIYIYHVESEYGNHVGRFAVIK